MPDDRDVAEHCTIAHDTAPAAIRTTEDPR